MDGPLSASHSANPGNPHGGLPRRRSPNIRPDDAQHKLSADAKSENQTPVSLPTALNGMLKNTIETGDIGQFAIKPSHPAPSRKPLGSLDEYLLQRPQQVLRPQNRRQDLDDRRRLPSYARATTSEIVSLSETDSQKVSNKLQVMETSGARSYSMTQTSNRSNVLSNYRSYTSLRSHPEIGLLPRPRSPFLYPARPRRLGFRPSSPIPMGGGNSEGGRVVERECGPYTTGAGTRSAYPLSSYHNRPPLPLPAQLDSNNTSPSQLGRLPSGSRSYSPSLRSMTHSIHDWSTRPEVGSVKASIAGNKFGSTSAAINHSRPPNSHTRSTNKPHTPSPSPSPSYYDYAEDFNLEKAAAGDATSTIPIHFTKNVHESRGKTPDASPQYDSGSHRSPTNADPCAMAILSNLEILGSSDNKVRSDGVDGDTERSINVTQDIIPLYLDRQPYDRIVANPSDSMDFALSDQSASTLNRILQSKSGASNSLSPIRLDAINGTSVTLNAAQFPEAKESLDQDNRTEGIPASESISSFRFSTYLPNFPEPPDQRGKVAVDEGRKPLGKSTLATKISLVYKPQESAIQASDDASGCSHHIRHNHLTTGSFPQFQAEDLPRGSIQRSATTNDRRIRSSRYFSIDHGLSDLAQLIHNFEFANESFLSQDKQPAETTTPLSLQLSTALAPSSLPKDPLLLPSATLSQLSHPLASRTPINRFRSDGHPRASNSRTFGDTRATLHDEVSNLDHQGTGEIEAASCFYNAHNSIYKVSLSHPEAPLPAPKAISPARAFRLKNSVPQLMKALPPIPPNLTSESLPPPRSSPHEIAPMSPPTDLEHREGSTNRETCPSEPTSFQSIPVEQELEDITGLERTVSVPSKFRIKSRFFDAQRSHTPSNSSPWNLNESYPWHDQQLPNQLSSLRSMIPGIQKGPKFKLRVTRSSISPSGTIRVNPEAKSSLDLWSPKDLFTSSSNLSGIFRQVSRQFSSRKSSADLETAPGNGIQAHLLVSASSQTSLNHEHNLDLLVPPASPTVGYPTRPTEERSFFSEDSSQIRGYNSLRKRISNLRARIPSHYTSRPAAHSNDNEASRGRITPDASARGRSRADVNSEQEDEYGMPIARLQHKKLRSKVTRWFKDARLALRRGVKLQDKPDNHCIPCG